MAGYLDQYIEAIAEEYGDCEYISMVKTGKEAQVHLLRTQGYLVALKTYKENTKFSSRNQYFALTEIGNKRWRRAVANKSGKGNNFLGQMWPDREYSTLEQLYQYGVPVPRPLMNLSKAILMEYLGDLTTPAPRLIDVELDQIEARNALLTITDAIHTFWELGFVHGDLSAYNILWHANTPYIIDFPQIVQSNNRNAREKLAIDVGNIEKYFSRYQLDRELETLRELSWRLR